MQGSVDRKPISPKREGDRYPVVKEVWFPGEQVGFDLNRSREIRPDHRDRDALVAATAAALRPFREGVDSVLMHEPFL
jgi:hypothetical protein